MGLADLHIHTVYSYDGTASVPSVLARARQAGLDVIGITDHDEIRGALKAFELAPEFGVEVIPGTEITTAEGDLLALFVTQNIPAGRPLIETILRVGEEGGVCIAPHPTARGAGMKSLSGASILRALDHPVASRVLIGIETYNATALDREGNLQAQKLWEECPPIARVGNSDAHILQAIGLGATAFMGNTAAHLLDALWIGATEIHQGEQMSSAHMLGSWALNFVMSAPARIGMNYR